MGGDAAPPASSSKGWKCVLCGAKNGAKYDFCRQRREKRSANAAGSSKTKASGSSTEAADAEPEDNSLDEKQSRCAKLRARLGELKKIAEDPLTAGTVAESVAKLESQVAEAQAECDQHVPRCFTECRVVRDKNRMAEQKEKCANRLAAYKTELAAKQQQVSEEEAKLERLTKKLDELKSRIENLAAPAPGKGWNSAAEFMQQAAKCPDQQGAQDPKLQEALQYAQEKAAQEKQKKEDEEKAAREAKAAENAQKAMGVDDAAGARSRGGSRKRRDNAATGEAADTDLLVFTAGATSEAIKTVLVTGGVPDAQADTLLGGIKLLCDGLTPGHTVKVSRTQWIPRCG